MTGIISPSPPPPPPPPHTHTHTHNHTQLLTHWSYCSLALSHRYNQLMLIVYSVTGPCVGNSPVTGEFPAQMPSNAENVSIWWRHHECHYYPFGDVESSSWRLELPVNRVSVKQFVQTDNKETSQFHAAIPLWGESTVDRWIPRTKRQ